MLHEGSFVSLSAEASCSNEWLCFYASIFHAFHALISDIDAPM